MLGFKRFDNVVVTISGIEVAEKGKFKTGKLGGRKATMSVRLRRCRAVRFFD
jgi:hypothetical protein